jgi:hypothetical protein
MSEGPPPGEPTPRETPDPTPVNAVRDHDEFVWTPAKRVSVLAALVFLQHGEPDELEVHFNGLHNAERAGLARLEPSNWHVTPSGLDQLRHHDLMETYTVTPRPVSIEPGEASAAEAAAA